MIEEKLVALMPAADNTPPDVVTPWVHPYDTPKRGEQA